MRKEKKNEKKGFFQRPFFRSYPFLTVLTSIPLIIFFGLYTSSFLYNDGAPFFTIALVVLFYLGIFTGRYLSSIYTSGKRPINDRLFVMLSISILIVVIFMFIHAQISGYSRGRNMPMNILIAGVCVTFGSLAIGLLIKLVRFSISQQLTTAQATAEQSISELHFLQSQLSPHFLFNTLNNLYGLSLNRDEKIPQLLLKLSDLLRYSVYDGKELFVSLKEEINYINNYIDFEQIRIGDRLQLRKFIEQVENEKIQIPPLLLIVFIENAFKHARNSLNGQIHIAIELKTFGSHILFSVENSYNRNAEVLQHFSPLKSQGLGLENVKKRLELLYPQQYELITRSEEDKYAVYLQLKK